MAETMRAARFHADTKTTVLEDIPIPTPGAGEVLVKIAGDVDDGRSATA